MGISLIIDIFTSSLPFLGIAAGAMLAVLAKTMDNSFITQLATFLLSSAFFVVLYLVYVKKALKSTIPKTPTLEERILGQQFILEDELEHTLTHKVDGIYWILLNNSGSTLKAGDMVKICKVKGTKLVVEKVRKDNID